LSQTLSCADFLVDACAELLSSRLFAYQLGPECDARAALKTRAHGQLAFAGVAARRLQLGESCGWGVGKKNGGLEKPTLLACFEAIFCGGVTWMLACSGAGHLLNLALFEHALL